MAITVRAAIWPLLAVGLAALLSLVSDRLIYVGPFDRATFGWLVVVPTWAVAPAAAGLAGPDLGDSPRGPAALIDGLVVGAVVGAVIWWSAVTVGCLPTRTPIELAVPAILLGVLAGAAFAFACYIAGGQAAGGHPWRALAFGAIPQVLTFVIVPIASFYMFFGLCQRPTAG